MRHYAHTVDNVSVSHGGPSRTIPALCKSVADAGEERCVTLLALMGDSQLGQHPRVDLFDVPGRINRGFYQSLVHLHQQKPIALVHDHGQWLRVNHAAASFASKLDLPRIVSPRGMLTPWARRHNRMKKKIAWGLFARRDLMRANLLHATSTQEADNLRALGWKREIAIIPNGVQAPHQLPERTPQSTAYVLFLGRIHKVKGIHDLLEAWKTLRPNGMELMIAGPDEQGMMARISLPDSVRYVGSVKDANKWELLRNAELLVLPSYSENFGVAVAESLVCETPVIATRGTPWSMLPEKGCGWWVESGAKSIAQALNEALSLSSNQRDEMGKVGRDYAVETYSWSAIGYRMTQVYDWLLDGGHPPDTVQSSCGS